MTYHPGAFPSPSNSTALPFLMLLSSALGLPGPPSQHAAKKTVWGLRGGSLLVGVGVGVSVGEGVCVNVGGNGVGEAAAAVCVRRSYAACATAVATAFTCGVAGGLQAATRMTRNDALSRRLLRQGCM
jgi:hypothetical protein